ncbi:UDP-glucose dehydrogenase family protein [Roseimaritima sediminicola]|uniref:UDP-glucose dehydrogenase family protein n=1 Tax=Roseimaritima sediminicola TaxID=2662066 RepID=UPI0012984932|nr:UDP-glucose/GDP-mannose dehydrogenase family protein [Roseimaritima sediminicola]
MKIAMIGTGYVGLVTGTCFADSGNDVVCVDIDEAKIAGLQRGKIPIYEPGLSELVVRNAESGRLTFTTDLGEAVSSSRIVYLAVGTPPAADGSADLTALKAVVDQMAPHLVDDAIVVTKSTVPVGTNQFIYERLQGLLGRDVDVASNPEFLKEGAAIDDFMKPDRVVVGVRRAEVAEVLNELYRPFLRTDRPFLAMSPQSAELTKYVANALLSTKISFINEMANLCERMGGDINDVRRGIGHDQRIGFAFLFPGVGYGGSCFPKDVRALASMARDLGLNPRIMDAVDEVNQHQKTVLVEKIENAFGGDIAGKRFAVWGLAFKPRTDDIREAPALTLLNYLIERGAQPQVHDPEATENIREIYGSKLIYCESAMDALNGADALAINTEWKSYHNPDFDEMKTRMNGRVVFDGRNLYEPEQMRQRGFAYHSIGRPPVRSACTETAEA